MSSAESSPILARFPSDIREAYRRFQEHHDFSAASLVVIAALRHYQSSSRADAAVSDTDRLFADLGYDSLAVAELIFLLEDLFSVTVANEELAELHTVGDVRFFIERKLSAPPARS